MSDLCIHIGIHKTGTTAIQSALRNVSQDSPHVEWALLEPDYSLIQQFMLAESYSQQLVDQLRSQLEGAAAKFSETSGRSRSVKQFVLSNEGLSGRADTGYQNVSVVAQMLKDAVSEFDSRIIVYLRRQDDWIESMYTQKIHEGESFGFDEFLTRMEARDSLNFFNYLNTLETCFDGKLIVRSYHQASAGGIVADFASEIGCDRLSSCAPAKRVNASYSRFAVEVARLANRQLDQSDRRRLRFVLQDVMAKSAGERFSFFTEQQRREFLERFSDTNTAVADRWFGGDVETVFPAPEADGSSPMQPAGEASEIADLVVQLLQSVNARTQKPASPQTSGSRRSPFARVKSKLKLVARSLKTGRSNRN